MRVLRSLILMAAATAWLVGPALVAAQDGPAAGKRPTVPPPTFDDRGREVIAARSIPYDTLVLALGSTTNDFGTPGAAEHAISLDTPQQAALFHSRLLNACLRANAQEGPLQPGQLHIAIIGAGATGVELAAELHNTTREFVSFGLERIDPERDIKLSIVEAAPRILPALPERLSNSVLELLRKLNVEVITGERVTEVSDQGLKTASGRAGRYPARASE